MKNKLPKALLICQFIICTLIVSTDALAQKKEKSNTNEKSLLEARRNHKQRIQEGIKSGTLTKAEAKKLTDMEDKVKQAMYKAKNNDGQIDESERDQIKEMLLKLNQEINELKNNADKR